MKSLELHSTNKEKKSLSTNSLKRVGKILLLTCAIGIPFYALCQNLPAVLAATRSAHLGSLLLVAIGLIFYTALNASVWADVLRALGWKGTRLQATRTWVQSEAMKWLPGGIWGYASRVVKAPEIGASKSIATASLVAELLLTIFAWGILALIGLSLDRSLLDILQKKLFPATHNHSYPILFGIIITTFIVIIIGLLLTPPLRRAFLRKLAPLRIKGWRWQPLLRALASYLGLCAMHAALLMVLVHAIHPGSFDWGSAAAADGASWLIGFFAIGIPGGIGVREAGITFFLSTHMSTPEAMAIAVLWRVLQILAELLTLGVSHLFKNPQNMGSPAKSVS